MSEPEKIKYSLQRLTMCVVGKYPSILINFEFTVNRMVRGYHVL